MDNKLKHYCRICGFFNDDPPWGEEGKDPSHNICDCCGTEFGYEDCNIEAIKNQREQWLKNGGKWFSPKEKPDKWSLERQLENIPDKFK